MKSKRKPIGTIESGWVGTTWKGKKSIPTQKHVNKKRANKKDPLHYGEELVDDANNIM